MSESRSEADITEMSDRTGPPMWRGIQSISQRDCAARVPGHHHHRTVDAAVSRPEAVAFHFPRGPEGHWRVRRTGPPVQMRRRMLGDPNRVAYVSRNDDSAPTHG